MNPTDEQRQDFIDGIDQAAAMFPLIDDEGYRRGWQACANSLAMRIRSHVAEHPELRTLLIEVMNG